MTTTTTTVCAVMASNDWKCIGSNVGYAWFQVIFQGKLLFSKILNCFRSQKCESHSIRAFRFNGVSRFVVGAFYATSKINNNMSQPNKHQVGHQQTRNTNGPLSFVCSFTQLQLLTLWAGDKENNAFWLENWKGFFDVLFMLCAIEATNLWTDSKIDC